MAGSTLYDRVRAAYDLDDDGNPRHDTDTTGTASNNLGGPDLLTLDDDGADSDAYPDDSVDDSPSLGSSLQPLATERPPETSVNSIRVPFDPEEQSDDEVILTSVYERQNNIDKSSAGGSNKPARSMALSATAPPFQPQSSGSQVAALPLLDIAGFRRTARDDAGHGLVYPGRRVGFCPWEIVTHYPVWFVGKQNSERIQPYFQTDALLQCQRWDFCYLWHPAKEKMDKHVLLIPTEQFQHLLDRINQTLTIQLTIPPGVNGDKFRVIFGQQKTPIPRFLGHAPDAKGLAALVEAMPPLHRDDAVYELAHAKHQAQDMYLKKVNGLLYKYDKSGRKKNKSDKAKKKRIYERKLWGKQIKRIQRYVGLREKAGEGSIQDKAFMALQLNKLVPHTPENDIVFVAMDIESYEYNHRVVTEIGFGILDTRDLVGTPPGLCCENWHALIRGRHFRIREHATMVNRTFVHGCENNFNFGQTEFVGVKDVLAVITSILQPGKANGEPRNVVLVGHDIKSDISLVRNVGFHVKDGMFLEIVDTQYLHQHYRMLGQQMGLKGVLNDLEIEHCFLHNGGNDAVYTLQAMVSLIITKRQDSLRRQNERLQPNYSPDPDVVQQGWDTNGEMSDGGYPRPKVEFEYEEGVGELGTRRATPSSSTTESPRKNPSYEASPDSTWGTGVIVKADGSEDLIEF